MNSKLQVILHVRFQPFTQLDVQTFVQNVLRTSSQLNTSSTCSYTKTEDLRAILIWRALQEGKVYVKHNLTDEQITVTDIQEKILQGDSHLADRIMRFGESLRGSRQFWLA